jgi:hypothetical protein
VAGSAIWYQISDGYQLILLADLLYIRMGFLRVLGGRSQVFLFKSSNMEPLYRVIRAR